MFMRKAHQVYMDIKSRVPTNVVVVRYTKHVIGYWIVYMRVGRVIFFRVPRYLYFLRFFQVFFHALVEMTEQAVRYECIIASFQLMGPLTRVKRFAPTHVLLLVTSSWVALSFHVTNTTAQNICICFQKHGKKSYNISVSIAKAAAEYHV